MEKKMLAIRLFLMFLAAAISAQVNAFEIDGISSYMKEEDAIRLLKKRYQYVQPVKHEDDRKTRYQVFSDTSPSSIIVVFCNKHLIKYNYGVPGGFKAFVRLVERENALRGDGLYEVYSEDSSIGNLSNVSFSWVIDLDLKEISIAEIDSPPTVNITYSSINECDKEKIIPNQ